MANIDWTLVNSNNAKVQQDGSLVITSPTAPSVVIPAKDIPIDVQGRLGINRSAQYAMANPGMSTYGVSRAQGSGGGNAQQVVASSPLKSIQAANATPQLQQILQPTAQAAPQDLWGSSVGSKLSPALNPGNIVQKALPLNGHIEATDDGMIKMDLATFKSYNQNLLQQTGQLSRDSRKNMLAEILNAGG